METGSFKPTSPKPLNKIIFNLNLPNKLTLFRIFLLPLLVVFLINPSPLSCFIAAIIFGIASFTDWLDGYLARMTNQVTTLGELLDPLADKLLIVAAIIPLVKLGRVAAWIAVVLIGREFVVTGLRLVASSHGMSIPVSNFGKYKTFTEIIAIVFLILNFNILGTMALWVALMYSILSGVDYFLKFLS